MPRVLTVAAALTVVAASLVACRSKHPMQPRQDPPPARPAAARAAEPRPSAWPDATPVPQQAVAACAGRGAGESCWLYDEDAARNGDCVSVPADAGQVACWTTVR